MDELAKAEGFDRPQIFIAEDISCFEQVACADSNCKISESAGDHVTDSENDTDGGVVAGCAGKKDDSSLEKHCTSPQADVHDRPTVYYLHVRLHRQSKGSHDIASVTYDIHQCIL